VRPVENLRSKARSEARAGAGFSGRAAHVGAAF
jgi:hypothetical protein